MALFKKVNKTVESFTVKRENLSHIISKLENNLGKLEEIKGAATGKIYYIFKPFDKTEEMQLLTFEEVYIIGEHWLRKPNKEVEDGN